MKPTYKNIKEIKSIFKIDISDKTRKIEYVCFRAFYVEELLIYLNCKNSEKYRIISKEINTDRSAIYNLIKQLEYYKTGKETKLIYKAFTLKDKKYLDEHYEKIRKKQAEYSKTSKSKEILKNFVPTIVKPTKLTKFDKNKALLSNLKLAEYLRLNKEFRHICWGIPVNNISENQWKGIRNINKEMFDRYTSKI